MSDTLVGGGSLRTPMTWEAFSSLGEAKHREYFDGLCVVNPPNRRHARAVERLAEQLKASCPATHEVLTGWGWEVPGPRQFQPDVLVASVDAPDDDILRRPPPLLVVEVSSPSTRDIDWGPKLAAYGLGGAAWYWIIDLEGAELVVFERQAGELVESQRLAGPGVTIGPFPVRVDPAHLGV